MPFPTRRGLFTVFALVLASSLAAQAEKARQPPLAPQIGGGINLSQGKQPNLLGLARNLGITQFRDGMAWKRVEQYMGRHVFNDPRTSFPDQIAAIGSEVTLVVNWGNPLYDKGDTPHSDKALSALGKYVAAVVNRFEAVTAIEVGNEFNGVNFVTGPIKELPPLERARAYVPMLRAAAREARQGRPDIKVLGGATHSLPGGYLWAVMDAGGGPYMDALAVHPYTTPAEQFVRQMSVLRRHPALADMPVEVTEFGTPDPARAPAHMLRNYCQFALAGVSRAMWFPANLRGEKMAPLFTPQGLVTPAGRAFRQIKARMAELPVTDAAPDDFTYGCQFGDAVQVLWGAPRAVTVGADVTAFDAMGRMVSPPLALDASEPLVLVSSGGAIAGAVMFGPQTVIADSYDQFAYPDGSDDKPLNDGFDRFARKAGRDIALQTLPGQERSGVPWFPYRGNARHRGLRLTAETLLPGKNTAIVHRFVAPQDVTLRLQARFAPARRSEDGVLVTVTVNGAPLLDAVATAQTPAEIDYSGLALNAADALEISVSDNGTPRGDVTRYRITLLAE